MRADFFVAYGSPVNLPLPFHRLSFPIPFASQTAQRDPESSAIMSALDLYFMEENGGRFKTTLVYMPYILLRVKVRSGSLREDNK